MPTVRLPKAMSRLINAAVAKGVAAELASRPGQAPQGTGQKARGQEKPDIRLAIGMKVKTLWLATSSAASLPASVRDNIVKSASMYEGVFGQGGALLSQEYSSEIIPLLRNRAVLLEAGAVVQPFTGALNIGRINSGAVAEFVAEGTAPSQSNYGTDAVILTGHKLMALAEPSKDMLRSPDVDSAGLITDDLIAAIAQKADEKGFLGDGTGANPKGLVKLLASGQKVTGTAITSANATNVVLKLQSMQQKVKASNLPFEGNAPCWVFNSRTEFALKSLRDSAGWLLKDEMDQGRLFGHPFHVTENVGDGYVFFGLAKQLYFGIERGTGEGGMPLIEVGEPNFKADLQAFKAILKCDWKLRYTKAWSWSDDFTYA